MTATTVPRYHSGIPRGRTVPREELTWGRTTVLEPWLLHSLNPQGDLAPGLNSKAGLSVREEASWEAEKCGVQVGVRLGAVELTWLWASPQAALSSPSGWVSSGLLCSAVATSWSLFLPTAARAKGRVGVQGGGAPGPRPQTTPPAAPAPHSEALSLPAAGGRCGGGRTRARPAGVDPVLRP